MTKSLADTLAERLEKEHITPEPAWKITMEKILYIMSAGVLVLLSGMLLSFVMLHIIQFAWFDEMFAGNSVEMMQRSHRSQFWLGTFPYTWFTLSLVIAVLATYVWYKTPQGYRHHASSIFLVATVFVCISAFALHASRINERAERFMMHRAPAGFEIMVERPWNRADQGFLGGRIVRQTHQGTVFDIETRDGLVWHVMTDGSTIFYGKDDFDTGSLVLMRGHMQSHNDSFRANTVKIMRLPQSSMMLER